MGIYPLTYSSMAAFDQCQLKYKRQYIDRDCGEFKGSKQSRYGDWIHKTFEIFLLDDVPLPESLHQFQPMLESVKNADGEKHYELAMAVKKDKTSCSWSDPNCWQRGYADLVIVNEELGIARDWKSGKPYQDKRQLMLMAALMFSKFPTINKVDVRYKWLFHPCANDMHIIYTRDRVDELWDYFSNKSALIDKVVLANSFKPMPSGLCKWCDAFQTCSFAKH